MEAEAVVRNQLKLVSAGLRNPDKTAPSNRVIITLPHGLR